MKTLIKIPVFALLIFILSACPKPNVENVWFILENNSQKKIYVLDGYVKAKIDTTIPNLDSTALIGPLLLKDSKGIVRNRPIKMDSMSLFIIDADTLNKYGWKRVRSEYKIVQRYDINITDTELKRLEYKLSYPPTENMKYIHMYPPYNGNR